MNPTEIGALTILLAASASVAAAEALLLALRQDSSGELHTFRQSDGPFARLLGHSDAALTAVQVVELGVQFGLALLVTAAVSRDHGVGTVLCAIGVTVLVSLTLTEIVRGLLFTALRRAAAIGSERAPPWRLRLFSSVALLLEPFGRLVDKSADYLGGLLPGRRRKRAPAISSQEVNQLLGQASRHGALLHGESKVLLNLVAFGTRPVKFYMTPRTEIDVLDIEWPVDQVVEAIRRTRHRRFPVVQGSFDRVLGCVVAKEYSLDLEAGLEAHLRPLPYVPQSNVTGDVFQEMRAKKNHMALVVDEYGSVEGMVTVGGLVSRLMGEIPDEFTGDPARVLDLGERRFVVDGALSIEQINAELGLALPLAPNTTIGGHVFSLIGHLPQQGARVERDGVCFHVLSLRRNRIVSIQLEVP